jgi:hypothetical protein
MRSGDSWLDGIAGTVAGAVCHGAVKVTVTVTDGSQKPRCGRNVMVDGAKADDYRKKWEKMAAIPAVGVVASVGL